MYELDALALYLRGFQELIDAGLSAVFNLARWRTAHVNVWRLYDALTPLQQIVVPIPWEAFTRPALP